MIISQKISLLARLLHAFLSALSFPSASETMSKACNMGAVWLKMGFLMDFWLSRSA